MNTTRCFLRWLLGAGLVLLATNVQQADAQDFDAVAKRLAKAVVKGEISWEQANVMLGALEEFQAEHERYRRPDRERSRHRAQRDRGRDRERNKHRADRDHSMDERNRRQHHEVERERPPRGEREHRRARDRDDAKNHRSSRDRRPRDFDRRPPTERRPPMAEGARDSELRRPAPPRGAGRPSGPNRRMDGPPRGERKPLDRPPRERDQMQRSRERRERTQTDDRVQGQQDDRPSRLRARENRGGSPPRRKQLEDIEIEMRLKDGTTTRTSQFEIVLQNLEKRLKGQVEEGKLSEEEAEQTYNRVRNQLKTLRDRQQRKAARDDDEDR